MKEYHYKRSGRNLPTLVTVGAVWVAIAMLYYAIDLAGWIAVLFLLFTIPALYDLVVDREAGLSVSGEKIEWFAGRQTGESLWSKVEHVRFDTRIDLSVKISLVLHNGRRVKLPIEATPPHRELEAVLENIGVKTSRHHFSFV